MEDNDYTICDYCGDKVKLNDTVQAVGYNCVCQDCINTYYLECEQCGKFVLKNDTREVEGDWLCECCFENCTNRCNDCRKWFYTDNLAWLNNLDIYVCEDCRDNYSCCEDCDDWFLSTHGQLYNDRYLCDSCIDYHQEENEEREVISTFSGRYRFYRLPDESEDSLYFGIELEAGIHKDTNINFQQEIINKLPDCFFVHGDSSIYDCNWVKDAIEIVSHPMTYKWLKKNRQQWNKILRLRKKGLLSYKTNSCGIHIHLTKSYFTEKHLYYFMIMVYRQPVFTTLISQRKARQLKNWGSLTDAEDIKDLKKKAKDKHFYKRYTAVNLSNPNTIEIRIFRGTLDECAFWKNIEYIQALIEFTKRAKRKDLTLKQFLRYVKSKRRKFQHLYKWLNKKNKI